MKSIRIDPTEKITEDNLFRRTIARSLTSAFLNFDPLIENKTSSLLRAKVRVKELELKNVEFYQCNLDYFDLKAEFDGDSAGNENSGDETVSSASSESSSTVTSSSSSSVGSSSSIAQSNTASGFKVQAEDYTNASDTTPENKSNPNNACVYRGFGVDVSGTGDSGGGCHVGWTANGEWLDYVIDVRQAGQYKLTYRYASGHTGSVGAIQFKNAAGTTLNRLPVEGKGVWGQFHDLTTTVNLEAGQQTIRLYVETPGFDLNWFKLEYVGGSAPEAEPPTDSNVGNTCGASASDVITMTTATFAKVVEGSCLKYTVNNNTLRFGSWGGHVINFDVMGGETNVTHNIQGWIALGQPRGDVYIKINSLSVDTLSVMLEQW